MLGGNPTPPNKSKLGLLVSFAYLILVPVPSDPLSAKIMKGLLFPLPLPDQSFLKSVMYCLDVEVGLNQNSTVKSFVPKVKSDCAPVG